MSEKTTMGRSADAAATEEVRSAAAGEAGVVGVVGAAANSAAAVVVVAAAAGYVEMMRSMLGQTRWRSGPFERSGYPRAFIANDK